jgi:ATP-dependent Clp protease, protease subunit
MKTIYINYFDEITPTKTRAFMNACSQLLGTTPTPDKFYFLFASSGGNVESGIALYNFLRALPVTLAFHNIGAVDSIGTIVFLAGEERFATEHATFMIHGVTWTLNAVFDGEALGQLNSVAVHTDNKIVKIICERTKLTDSEIRSLFQQGESKDSGFAMDKGFIQQISQPVIPKNETLISFNFP